MENSNAAAAPSWVLPRDVVHKGDGSGLQRRAALQAMLLLAMAPCIPAHAQTWPSQPVKMVVPFSPGSTPDLVARVMAEHFRAAFGQPFLVDNRVGASGTIGTNAIAKATDGHTLGITINGPIATAKALYPKLPYDPAQDLTLISLLVRAPQLLVVHPSVPVQDMTGFIAHAKANPGSMSYGSVGPGSASHLTMEDLKARAGIDLVHVPYKGFPEATIDLVTGRIEAMFSIASAILPQVKEGKAKPLAVTADARISQAPEVPTMAEAGVADATSYAWIGLVAPAGTPQAMTTRLAEEARAALANPQHREVLANAGFEVVASGPEEFTRFVAAETERWGGMVRRLGITAGQ
jgi:tripartite-type tricarboxylate transporter receptor subunit TctC